jgi:uncharacterized protein YkwD
VLAAPLLAGACETQPATRTRVEEIDRQVFRAVNRERKTRAIPELEWHERAAKAAHVHSKRMAERNFFSHIDPRRGDLADRLKAEGISWTAIAENLFQQQGYKDPVERAVAGWLKSEGHKRNLLNPAYTHTGIGVATRSDGTTFYTQIFLRPAS